MKASCEGLELYLDSAFSDELKQRLSSDIGWTVCQEVKLPGMPPIWSKFDVGCYYHNKLVGLFELSVQDSNVPHALHNGEVKLLGICDGVSVNDANQNLKTYRKLNDSVVVSVQKTLGNIPVRGLFYTAGDGLYIKKKTIWFLTESKGRACFHSALFGVNSVTDLKSVFDVLQQKGLYTWYL